MDLQTEPTALYIPATTLESDVEGAKTLMSAHSFRTEYPGTPGEMLATFCLELMDKAPEVLDNLRYVVDVKPDGEGVVRTQTEIKFHSKLHDLVNGEKPFLTVTFVTTERDHTRGVWKRIISQKHSAQTCHVRFRHHMTRLESFEFPLGLYMIPMAISTYIDSFNGGRYTLATCHRESNNEVFIMEALRQDPTQGYDHVTIRIDMGALLSEGDRTKYRKLLKSV